MTVTWSWSMQVLNIKVMLRISRERFLQMESSHMLTEIYTVVLKAQKSVLTR